MWMWLSVEYVLAVWWWETHPGPERPTPVGVYPAFASSSHAQLVSTLSAGGCYLHKLFVWQRFWFYRHELSTVARGGDPEKNCDFQNNFFSGRLRSEQNNILNNSTAPRVQSYCVNADAWKGISRTRLASRKSGARKIEPLPSHGRGTIFGRRIRYAHVHEIL